MRHDDHCDDCPGEELGEEHQPQGRDPDKDEPAGKASIQIRQDQADSVCADQGHGEAEAGDGPQCGDEGGVGDRQASSKAWLQLQEGGEGSHAGKSAHATQNDVVDDEVVPRPAVAHSIPVWYWR